MCQSMCTVHLTGLNTHFKTSQLHNDFTVLKGKNNLPLFHTSLSLLWQTPRFISGFYEAPPSEIRDGLRLVSWLSVLWFAKPPLLHVWTSRPSPQWHVLRWIVNSGVVYNAYLHYRQRVYLGLSGSVTYQTREVTRCSPLPVVFVGIKLPEF